MVPNTGHPRQMGCLGSFPGDEAERDEYQPVDEETASVLSRYGGMMWAVCVDCVQLHIAAVSPEAWLFATGIFCVGRLSWKITWTITCFCLN